MVSMALRHHLDADAQVGGLLAVHVDAQLGLVQAQIDVGRQ
jgi:hypothetical protein